MLETKKHSRFAILQELGRFNHFLTVYSIELRLR